MVGGGLNLGLEGGDGRKRKGLIRGIVHGYPGNMHESCCSRGSNGRKSENNQTKN